MTDDERHTRQPLSMTRRYRRGLILTGLLCALAVLTAATVLFQRSYAERIDNYLMQICHGYAAAYEAQDTHSAATLLNLLPENLPLRITLIDTDGTVLYDTKRGSYIVDVNGDIYAAQTDLPNHADRPEFQQAMASGSACITRESETLQLARQKSSEIIRRAEDRSKELYHVANTYTEDALRRTEEAIQAALTEVQESRARFRAASKEQMQAQRQQLNESAAEKSEGQR